MVSPRDSTSHASRDETVRQSTASTMDSSIFQDVTRSMDSLRTTLSISGLNIPRFDNFCDVFEFIAEYEMVTTGLDDHQKIILLAKAFPIKCHRAFYEAELSPLVSQSVPWLEAKRIIINRFADTDDRDRHLARLRELRFDHESGKSLLDYVEELFHSYKRAYPKEVSRETSVAFIKAAIPHQVRQ